MGGKDCKDFLEYRLTPKKLVLYLSMSLRPKARWKHYGITEAQYKLLYSIQKGRCAICDRKERIDRNLCIDHDHNTGRVRGLLCGACNINLGLIERDDDPVKRLAIIHLYLVNPPIKDCYTPKRQKPRKKKLPNPRLLLEQKID